MTPTADPTFSSAERTSPVSLWPLAIAAVGLAPLLAYNVSPSATFFNQALAYIGWGVFAAWLAMRWLPRDLRWNLQDCWPALVALLLMGLGVLVSVYAFGLPTSLGLSSLAAILSAVLVMLVGAALARAGHFQAAFHAFCVALLVAGLASLVLACVQGFAPTLADGNWIARESTPGRVGGNLRQPNHLSSLLLWSMVALMWLHDAVFERDHEGMPSWPARGLTVVLMVGLTLGVVLTVSRTGMVCIAMLTLWALIDRRLSPFMRRLLWVVPLIYVLCWIGVADLSPTANFAGDNQLHKSDLSSSRFAIWSNTLTLMAHNPWFGVGWGGFNFAWTLTPFPGRPTAFFDHTHNIVLQFLVELGWPLGSLVLGLLAFALWKGLRGCLGGPAAQVHEVRATFVMVLMMVVHSMLEYPLWYAYFLLPTLFAFGLCLGGGAARKSVPRTGKGGVRASLAVASVVLACGASAAVFDYLRVAAIFASDEDAAPLSTRIRQGQTSWFFAYHANYADATTSDRPAQAMGAFHDATHFLLDTRLMMAWARAYNEVGDTERARYLVDRLREFGNTASAEFFAECDVAREAQKPLPFQCTPSTRSFSYSDFR
jgi:O-antigen ligase